MKLTKQEQAVVIGRLINNILGVSLVEKHIEPQKLEKAVSMCNEMIDNTTPKQARELLISVLEKAIDELLKA
ncbi:hypothetical protein COE40_19025 [Bacillus cereus]|nr:hypothetical protein COE40_19025 [Bacillus cereus]